MPLCAVFDTNYIHAETDTLNCEDMPRAHITALFACMHMNHQCTWYPGKSERVSDFLELETEAVVNFHVHLFVLGTEPVSSARRKSTLIC